MKKYTLMVCLVVCFALAFSAISNAQLTVVAWQTASSCSNENTAVATSTGGTTPYTYLWNDANSQTSATATGLSAGSYTVKVTDKTAATATASVTLVKLQVSIASQTNPLCNGNTNGSLAAVLNTGSVVITSTFPYTGVVQNWTVPSGITQISITLAGAQGGFDLLFPGHGAIFTGMCTVIPGHILSVVAGQQGLVGSGFGGGGGASWVYDSTITGAHGGTPPLSALLAVAGGGGAQGHSNDGNDAGTDLISNVSVDNGANYGGVGGNGGQASNYGGAGGAGWLSNGMGFTVGSYYAGGGNCWAFGFGGGNSYSGDYGGYGGGGGGYEGGGGGGGGYNGGGGDKGFSGGGGGGSYLNGTVIGGVVANQAGNGFVTIQYAVPIGTPPFTYTWSPGGQTNSTATGLNAGIYIVTVTDNGGCTTTASATLTQPGTLTITGLAENNVPNCNGIDNATVSISGGTTPYTYLWSDPIHQTTATADNLTGGGSYTVIVTDNHGCSVSSGITITAPTVLRASAAQVGSYCTALNIQAIGTGGTMPYTYLWSDPSHQTTDTATGLSAGTYTVTITDNKGCSATASATILSFQITIASTVNAACNGSTGTLTAGVVGEAPYTYSWAPTGGTNVTANVTVGTYTVTVTDHNGCSATASGTITQPAVLTASVGTPTHVSCYGNYNGSAALTVAGGTLPYTYLWLPGGYNTVAPTNLFAATYTVMVTDNHGCTATTGVTITQPAALSASAVQNTFFCVPPLSAQTTAIGGTLPYTYLWSDVNSQATATAINLSDGTYTVFVSDNHGCATITQTAIGTLGIDSISVVQPSCNGGTGTIIPVLAGGYTPINEVFTYTGAVQNWTVPNSVSQITISLCGGQGGSESGAGGAGGFGANFTGICTVKPGDVLSVVVGGMGTEYVDPTNFSSNIWACGGGGASWVYDSTITGSHSGTPPLSALLAVAGGGGGSDGNIAANGGIDLIGNTTTTANDNGTGGILGNGGNRGTDYSFTGVLGAGGAGWFSNGQDGYTNGGACWANDFINGSNSYDMVDVGGYGGGGDGYYDTIQGGGAAGGGGGFNGGGGGNILYSAGGGGGSYLKGTVVGGPYTAQSGNGYVTIQYTTPAGIQPFTYSWAPGGGTNLVATGVSAGTYTLTVQDNNGCSATVSATVTQPTQLTISNLTEANIRNCNGVDSATVSVTGGTSPYNYLWNDTNSQNTANVNLSGGKTYTVTVTDNNGCNATASITIIAPRLLLTSAASISNASAATNTDGQAVALSSGGVTAYTYLWSNGKTTDTISGASGGVYSVKVTDMNGCNNTATATITRDSTVRVEILYWANPLCNGGMGNIAAVIDTPLAPVAITFPFTGNVQNWQIPPGVSQITATIAGASGGASVQPGGGGAFFTGRCLVTPGHILSVVVGGQGGSGLGGYGGGGGGASWVYDSTLTGVHSCTPPLSALVGVAGGGGGGCTDFPGAYAQLDKTLFNSATPSNGSAPGGQSYNGGTGGIGNGLFLGGGAGGAGWYSGGRNGYNCTGGGAWSTDFAGGLGDATYSAGNGGFGGGGGGSVSGGGGGGVNGGGGGYYVNNGGGGGGCYMENFSYQNPLSINYHYGNGYVTIQYFPPTATPYTYSWAPSGGTNLTATGLSAGAYTLTVTDAMGSSKTASANITQPAVLLPNATVVKNNSACTGNMGVAQATPTGDTPPYTYLWSDANTQTTASATGLSAGTYTVTVTDAKGCNATASATITQAAALSANSIVINNVTCYGGANGSVSASPAGGDSPYKYLWSNSSTNAIISNLSSATYSVTITDKSGCSVTASVSITQPTRFQYVSAGVVSYATCYGSANGKASVAGVGGNSPYTYSWSNGTTTVSTIPTPSNLSAGSYTVTVQDNCGVAHTASVTITQPNGLNSSIVSTTDVACFGGNAGTATATANGGNYPYSYLWAPGGSTLATARGLSAGNYTVTVTDTHGCSATNAAPIAAISQPSALAETLAAITYPACHGSEATATVAITGGVLPYSYTWSGGLSTTASCTKLVAGSYTVTVKDKNSCSASLTFAVTQPNAIHDSSIMSAKVYVSCNGGSNGSITIGVKYGTPPYTYTWTPAVSATNFASNLSAGTYSVIVTDNTGCSSSTEVVSITQPTILRDSMSATTCANNKITATIGVKGGTSPYTYSWSPGGYTKQQVTGLSAGTYTITVTDKNQCSVSLRPSLSCAPHALMDEVSTDSVKSCCAGFENIILYPNPNNGKFTLTGLTKEMIVEVYDYTGRKINTAVANNSTLQLNIYSHPNGIYLIRITSKDGTLVGQKKVGKTQ